MDKVTKHKTIVKEIILKYASMMVLKEPLEKQIIFDDERGHYLLMKVGWRNEKPLYGITFHIDVRSDGKVWVQRDNTDVVIVDDLLERGIPKNEIVLAFHAPYIRPHTDFAVV